MGMFDKGGYRPPDRHLRQSARHRLKKIRQALRILVWLGVFFTAVFIVVALFLKNPDRMNWFRFALFYAGGSIVLALTCVVLRLIEVTHYAHGKGD